DRCFPRCTCGPILLPAPTCAHKGRRPRRKRESLIREYRISPARPSTGFSMNELPIRRPTPTVSVVMPVSNGGPFLRQSPDSIMEEPFIGLLYTDFATIDAGGKVLSRVHLPPPPTRRARVVALMRRCFINGCASLIHRDVFAHLGLFDEADRLTYDYDMWLRI